MNIALKFLDSVVRFLTLNQFRIIKLKKSPGTASLSLDEDDFLPEPDKDDACNCEIDYDCDGGSTTECEG
ncbi:hypothetical protein ACFL2U_00550 [Patescibacteria group bacterium]